MFSTPLRRKKEAKKSIISTELKLIFLDLAIIFWFAPRNLMTSMRHL